MKASYEDPVKVETMVSPFPWRDVYTFQRIKVKTSFPRIKALRLFFSRFFTYNTNQYTKDNIWISLLHARVKKLRHWETTCLFAVCKYCLLFPGSLVCALRIILINMDIKIQSYSSLLFSKI